ncbi:MAG: cytochrome P450 [Novosphingobium sp.]|nr:cytochrome P450 [Novosphingobium sp.]
MNVHRVTSEESPAEGFETDSKTASMAAVKVVPAPNSRLLRRFAQLRQVLRDTTMRQAGAASAPTNKKDPTRASIFFLHGEAHRSRRAAIIRFFTPKAIATRHMPVMERAAEALTAEFRAKGRGRLDELSLRLSAAVAAEIVGMTNSNIDAMARRIEGSSRATQAAKGGIWVWIAKFMQAFYGLQVFYLDVKPAIAARRKERQEDVISRLLDEGRSDQEILVECMTFGLAGMTTTREFIVVAAWHLFDNKPLRQRFLDGDDGEKMAILMEILRLEPVAGMIYRSIGEETQGLADEALPAGTRLSLHIRKANLDEADVGPDPTRLDPDRAKRLKSNGAYMSFGDGEHFCPGWQVALGETRVFLDKLLRVPGIRLTKPPDMGWDPPMLQSYVLRNAIIECDRG